MLDRGGLIWIGGEISLVEMTRRALLQIGTAGMSSATLATEPRGSARAVVFYEISGGISHVDTFDFKENAATPPDLDVRAVLPGIYLSNRLFPRLSKLMGKFCIVRSMTSPDLDHFPAQYTAQTGRRLDLSRGRLGDVLAIGSLVAKAMGGRYVAFDLDRSYPGRLGTVDARPAGGGAAAPHELLAREAEIRYIHICHPGWDHHQRIWDRSARSNHYESCRELDNGLSSLIDGLAASALLDQTLVVAMSEFGRTPGKLNCMGGRDHHGACFPALFAGAGVKGGIVLGSSDAAGDRCVDLGWQRRGQPRMENVAATIFSALGIPWKGAEEIAEIYG